MSESKCACVVGFSGFVGSHVAYELLKRGYTVHGTSREPSRVGFTKDFEAEFPGKLKLFPVADVTDVEALSPAFKGCSGVFFSAGTEKQDESTVTLMVGAAKAVVKAAVSNGIFTTVFTSSTGSTNPPGPEPEIKREHEHYSDPDQQLSNNKFSPAAKTLMERAALETMEAESGGKGRVVIMNPSAICGPAFQEEPVASLKWMARIIKGEAMGEKVPNGSMSFIDVSDLAALHVNAFEKSDAQGRYFGVKRSWHWDDVLSTMERVCPGYKKPACDIPDDKKERPTQFDFTRQNTLGVEVRDLDKILARVVEELTRRKMINN